ncbi:DMT family transporter [Haladaptatus salinisoli]|uniref:DMT family transporter n=1 Tax=Haladaptatus salinisoli TaxID=2884876 RepID=UPI001D0ABF04|nr:DMT family transporter [Haladaptatus salinisoli]
MDSRHRNAAFFLTAAILTGGMYVANKAGLPYLPPVFFASLRFLTAATLLLPYVAIRTEPLHPQTHTDYLTILASGGLVVGAANVFLFVGQQYTTSATAAILISLSPILTVGLAAVVLPSNRLTRRGVGGVVLGLVGVSIVAHPDPSNFFSVTVIGMGILFLAAVSLAIGGVALRHLQSSLSPLAITAWATLVGGLAMFILSLARGEPIQTVSWTPVALLAVVYNGIIATPIGYVAYFSLLEAVGPVRVNLLTYVSPLVTALLGWLLLGEQLSLLTLVGFVVIATGFVLIEYQSLTREVSRLRRALP